MLRSKYPIALGAVSIVLLAIVLVTMLGSGSIVRQFVAADAQYLARDWLLALQARTPLPGSPASPSQSIVNQAFVRLLDAEDTNSPVEPYYGHVGNFGARDHFGSISGYAVYDSVGSPPLTEKGSVEGALPDGAIRVAAARAVATRSTQVIWEAGPSVENGPAVNVLVPLLRDNVITGLANVRVERHRFEIVLQKLVRYIATATALTVFAVGALGLLLFFDRGRAARRAQSEAGFLAYTDPATRLPNQRRFREELPRAIDDARRRKVDVAVIYCDVDNFKIPNDEFGHAIGDRLLAEIGRRLESVVGRTGQVFRLSGDNFSIILETPNGLRQVEAFCERVQSAMKAALLPDEAGVKLSLSMGVAQARDDGQDAERLMQAADLALFQAKAEGRRTYRLFHAGMRARTTDMARLQNALEEALAKDKLHLVYQPQVRAGDNKLVGFEALARWTHPIEGPISPDRFIAVAEQAGLIVQLGEWALRRACAEAALWPRHLSIAVNVSPLQLRGSRLIDQLRQILAQTGLRPERLELEVTEGVMMLNTDATQRAFEEIRALGVGLAMDDFGTGYSSLSYLTRIPLTKMKIDQSFIFRYGMDARDDAIVDALVRLGRDLGLKITAEGVETEAQAAWLRRAGCTSLQGYLFGKPTADPAAFIADSWQQGTRQSSRAVVGSDLVADQAALDGIAR